MAQFELWRSGDANATPPRILPAPVIEKHDGVVVVRDDLLSGGTKRRALHVLFDDDHDEYVYATPAYGHAQVALAHVAADAGKRATLFVAKRSDLHALTARAHALGATIREVEHGYLTVVQARARAYCEQHRAARLLPFGLDDETFIDALAIVARALPVHPKEVWSITSSGVLSRALQRAWPKAAFFGVQVGATPDAGRAIIYRAPERFEQPAQLPPPFPACAQYDAKVWRFIKQHASKGALFWSVA